MSPFHTLRSVMSLAALLNAVAPVVPSAYYAPVDSVPVPRVDGGAPADTITLTATPTSFDEDGGAKTLTVTATANSSKSTARKVRVSVGRSGDSAVEGTDYKTIWDFNVSILANATTGTGSVVFTPINRYDRESDETISVYGALSGHAVTGTSVTVKDDDSWAELTLNLSGGSSLGEGGGAKTFTLRLSAPDAYTPATVNVQVGASGDGATEGTDYQTVDDFSITLPYLGGSVSKSFTVTPSDDNAVEGSEGITVSAQSTNSNWDVQSPFHITLTDNDATTIALSASPSSVSEGGGGASVKVTATAAKALSQQSTVTVEIGGSGSAGYLTDYSLDDYQLNVLIAANKTTGESTFTLGPIQDNVVEGSETISIAGRTTAHSVTGTTLTLTDDDAAPEVDLSLSSSSVSEGTSKATVTVTAAFSSSVTYAANKTVTVSVGGSGTATSGTDYTAVSDFDITIAKGDTSSTGSFTLTPTDDQVFEGDETVVVSGTSTGLTVNDDTLTITENDDAAVTIADASADEGDTITFTVTLDKAVQGGLTVTPSFTNGTAADTDYTANTAALTFTGTAGETQSFKVATAEDAVVEGDETFTVGLTVSNAPSGVTATDTGTGTIEDDEEGSVTIAAAKASEGDSITFTATLSSATGAGFVVKPSYTNDGEAGSTDYAENTDTLHFAGTKGETRTFKVATSEDAVFEGDETFTVGLVADGTAPPGIDLDGTATGTIEDDDDAEVTIADADADEGDTITFTVTLDKAVQGGLTVTPSFTSGTAADTDYTANTAALTFTGTASETQTFKVATVEDAVLEADETFTVGLTVSDAPSGVTSTDTGEGTIENDDAAEVTVNDADADEGDTITFTVTLDKAVQGGLTVTPSFTSGTAADTDYTANTAALTFTGTADETQTFKVATVEDAVFEADETFTVSLTVSDAPSGVTSTDTGTGTIENDETAAVTVNDAEADEGDTITFTVTLDKAVQGGLTVTPSFTNGTAADTDYTANTAALTFTGTADETQTFKVATAEDAVLEADETFTVGLTVSKAPSGVTSTDTGEGTIENDDAAAVTVNDASADEGDSIVFTVTLDKAVQGGLTVTPSYTNGTAAGTDYTWNTGALSFTGTASETQTFKVATAEDAVFEADETFTVSLAVSDAPSGVTSTDTGEGTIENDESAAVTIDDAEADEGDTITFTVTLDNAVQGGLTVTPGYVNGTTASGDYTANTAALSFTGTANETKTFKVATVEDAVFEADETFTVGLTVSKAPSGITSADTGEGTIENDESAAVTIADASADEGDTITFTVTLDNAVQGGLTVTPGYTNGTAGKLDYSPSTSGVDFDGTANETRTFKVATREDAVFEADETFTVGLMVSKAPSGITSTDTGTGTIENDESAAVTIADASADEGDSIVFTVTLDNAVQGGLTVTPGYTNGTAATTDYTANTAALTFTGTADETQTFKVATVEDVVFEEDETFTVGLTVSKAPSGITSADTGEGTIENDESAAVTIADASADEGDTITFTVTLDNAVQGGLKVTPGYADGTTASGDYTANKAALTFTGTADETKTFKVATVEDQVLEADETFTVSLQLSGAPSGVTSSDTGTGTIENDDRASLSIGAGDGTLSDASAEEGDSIEFTLTLDKAVQGGLTVTPEYTNGTAADTDYTANTAALTFTGTADETKTFKVATVEDAVFEADETFTVSLTVTDAPSGVTVSGIRTGTIENDESAAVTVADAEAEEGDSITFTVTLDNAVQGGLTVTPGYADGTTSSGDYTANTAALTFTGTADETRTFKVATVEDVVFEADETFTVSLAVSDAPSGITSTDTGEGTIENDESAEVTIEYASADEGDSIVFTVTLDNAVQGGLTVTPGYTDGTAGSGDYKANTAALSFTGTANETKTFKVATVEDVVFEADETFTVGLSVSDAPPGVTDTDTGTGTVENDESASVTIEYASADEGDSIVFTVTLDNAVQGGLTVTPGYTDGTAGSGDYTANTAALTFAGTADETKTFKVATVEDTVFEADETFTVALTVTDAPSGVTSNTGTGWIENDESAEVTIEYASAEEGDSIEFTVTLDNAVQGGLTVTPGYTDGTAGSGDYTANTAALSFAGTADETRTLKVATVEDAVFEADEMFTVSLTVTDAPSGVRSNKATGWIENDESAEVTVADAGAEEGDSIVFTVTLDNAVQGGLTVTPGYADGTAGSGDYTANAAALSFAGTADETRTFKVATVEDAVFEADETFTVSLMVTDAPSGVTSKAGTGTIGNDESAAVTVEDASAEEGDSIVFTVTLNNAVQGGLTVTPGYANGTAADEDYTANAAALSFAGTADETRTFKVATVEDAVLEADETFTVSLTVTNTPSGVTSNTGTGTIENDDSATVTIGDVGGALGDASAEEGDSIEFAVTLDNAVQGGLTVTPGYANGTAGSGDYTANAAALSFAGTADETRTFKVATVEDAVFEADETFTVSLAVSNAPSGVTVGGSRTGTIENDESAAVAVEDASAEEGDSIVFTVTLDNAVQGGLTVTPGYANGTAGSGDYTANAAALSFAGTTDETRTFKVATVEDAVFEWDEEFTVTLAVSGAPAGVTDTDTGTGTIRNDDTSPNVDLGVTPASVSEDAAATGVTVTAAFSRADTVGMDIVVTVAVGDPLPNPSGGGTATPGKDYENVSEFDVVIPRGTLGGTGTFTLTPIQDSTVEGDETISVTGRSTELAVNGAWVTLTDDDLVAAVLSVDPAAVSEGDAATAVTVTLTTQGASRETVGVPLRVTGNTAVAGEDFEEIPDFELTIPAGAKTGTATFTLTPIQDSVVEGDETMRVTASVPGSELSEGMTLVEDDSVPEVNLIVDPEIVDEGASATEVTVTAEFSNASRFLTDTTVVVSVGGGTATAGVDHEAVVDFEVTISAGETSGTATFTLAPKQDSVVEGDEGVLVSGVVPGLAVNATEVELADDDEVPEVDLSVDPASVGEGASATEVTVTAEFSNGTTFSVDTAVTVSVGGGTATAGADYEEVADFRVEISAGETSGAATFTLAPEDDNLVEADESIAVSGAATGLVVHGTEVGLTDDDEVPEVVLSVDPASVDEGAGATAVTVTAALSNGGAFPVDTAVTVSVGGGTATAGADYTAVEDFRVAISAGETSGTATFTLAPEDDDMVEADERIGVSGAAAGLVVHGTEVTLTDDDEVPEVVLSVDPASVGEGASATAVTVTAALSNGSAFPVDTAVTVSVGGGTATAGADYEAVEDFRVEISAGETSGAATFTLAPEDDNLVEADERIGVSGAAAGLVVHGTEVELADDDEVPEVVLSVDPASVDEGAAAGVVTVTAELRNGGAFPVDTAVTVSVGGGTATAGADYEEVADFRVEISAGETSGAATFTLAPEDDNLVEADERIGVSGAAAGLVVHGTEVELTDDDEVPEVVLSVDPASVGEGAAASVVTVTAELRNGSPFPVDTAVTVSVGGGTATAGADYEEVADFRVAISAGETSGTATFRLAPEDDDLVEAVERIGVSGAAAGLVVHGTEMELTDDDEVPEVVLSVDPASVDESAAASVVTVTAELRNGSPFPVDTAVTVSVGGGTATADADYEEVADFRVEISAGETSGTATFTLAPEDDNLVEADEKIGVSGAAAGLVVHGTEMELTDDDEVPEVILSVDPASVDEGAAASVVTVTAELSNGSAFPVDTAVTVSVGGGTATAGADYEEVADFRVAISAGETSGTATFTLAPEDDDLVEAVERIGVSGAAAGLVVHGTEMELTDDDKVPEVVLSADPASVGEGAAASVVTVTAELRNGSPFPVDTAVTVSVGGGTATADADYEEVADFRVAISAGETSGTATFTLAPEDDNLVEAVERIGVSGAAAGLVVHGTEVTLADDDEVPEVVLSADPASVGEGAAASVVTVTAALSNGSAFPADTTVAVSVGGGTATAGADYEAVGDFRVAISAGETSGTATFTLAPEDDNLVEADEKIGVSGAAAGLVVHGTEVTLADDDEVPEVVLSADPASVGEGAAASVVTVTAALSNGSAFPADTAVTVSVGGGTATAGADYEAVGDFRVAISAGETSGTATFTLAPEDDNLVEAVERIGVSGAAAGLVVHGTEVTLADDDEVPEVVLSADPASVGEGAAASVVTVTAALSNGNAFPVDTAVAVSVGGGTATAGADYEAVGDFRVAISAGETSGTATFTLAPEDDNLVEADERIGVSGAAAGLVVHGTEVELTDDDEVPEVVLSVDPASVGEGAAASVVTVTAALSNGSAFPVDTAVTVSVGGGTATAGADYAAVGDFRVAISAGETSGTATFTLAPEDDNVVEADEKIGVSGAAAGLVVHGTEVELTDDEEIPEVVLLADPVRVAEGAPAKQVAVTATLSNGNTFPEDATVTVSVGGGTATAGVDYAEIEDFEIEISAGETSGAGTFTLAPKDDDLVEGDETIELSGAVLGGMVAGGGGTGGVLAARATITLADDDRVAKRTRALELGLARIARTVATQAVDAIGARFEASSRISGSGDDLAFDPFAVAGIVEAGRGGGVRLPQAGEWGAGGSMGGPVDGPMGGPGFGGGGFGGGGLLALALGGEGSEAGHWTLWASGARTGFSGRADGFVLDGGVGSAYVGVDRRLGSNAVVGVAVSRNQGGMDAEETDSDWSGDMDTRLTTVYPYVRWSPGGKIDLWGMVGVGRGDVELDDGAESIRTDGGLRMAAIGLRSDMARMGPVGLAVRADAFAAGMTSDEVKDKAGAADGNAQRARLMLDGSADLALSRHSRLTPSVEVGARADGGDAETGPGMELGGGLAYANSRLGLEIGARGRWLALHGDEDFGEWGGTMSVRRLPANPGRGLSVSLESGWGEDASGVAALWEGRRTVGGGFGSGGRSGEAADTWQPDLVEMEVAYGTGLPAARGSLRPFGQVRMTGAGSRDVRVGTRLDLAGEGEGGGLRLELRGEQRSTAGGAPSYGAGLSLAVPDIRTSGGLLAPFGEFDFNGASGQRLAAGTRWQLLGGADDRPGRFGIELLGEARKGANDARGKYGLVLRGISGLGTR